MVEIKRKTFEDLLGNVADDAKQAFDEILERPGAKQSAGQGAGLGVTDTGVRLGGPAGGLAGPAGGLAGTAGGLAGPAGDVTGAAGDLAALPGQIAQLSELIAKLVPAVESLTGTLSAVNPLAGEGASKVTSRR